MRQVLDTITAGIAKRIIAETTTIDQTNSGMRFNDIPGVRSFRTVQKMHVATTSDDTSENVMSCAQTSGRLPMPYSGPASGG